MTNGPHREGTSELLEDTIAQSGKFKFPEIPKVFIVIFITFSLRLAKQSLH